jgi:hypothetical protein
LAPGYTVEEVMVLAKGAGAHHRAPGRAVDRPGALGQAYRVRTTRGPAGKRPSAGTRNS